MLLKTVLGQQSVGLAAAHAAGRFDLDVGRARTLYEKPVVGQKLWFDGSLDGSAKKSSGESDRQVGRQEADGGVLSATQAIRLCLYLDRFCGPYGLLY